MKKVLLIIPPRGEIRDKKQMDSQFPRIGIAYIAAYLRERGHQVKILDAVALGLDAKKITDELKKEDPDFVGLGPFTEEIFRAYEVCKIAKKINKNIITVFGGPHASAMPKETLKELPLVDYVVCGEGEETFLNLINGKNPAEIKGIAYRNNKNIIINEPACPIENLDDLPYPAWDLYPLNEYKGSLNKNFYRKMNIPNLELPVLSMRGCPGNCNFCYKTYKGLELRDPIKVVNEIEFLINTYGVTDIFFSEGTFFAKTDHGLKICKEIIGRKLNKKISWVAETRVNMVDEESLKLMKEAGCEELYYGIETGDEKILKDSKKGITFDQMIDAVRLTKKAGIKPTCFSIIGHPYETEKSIDKTINLLIKLNSDMMNVAIMMPFPGTEIREMALRGEGNYRLLSNDWSTYTKQQGGPLELVDLPLEKLQKLQSKGYIKYFLRPQKIPYILNHFSFKRIGEIFFDLIKKSF